MYYLVAYGTTVRCEKALTIREAMDQAYGTVDPDHMTLAVIPKLPRLMRAQHLREVNRLLALHHFARTGCILGGWGKELGIANVHWTECQLCRKPIRTEPASAGIDEVCCSSCEEKLGTINPPPQASISEIREHLGIEIHRSHCCV